MGLGSTGPSVVYRLLASLGVSGRALHRISARAAGHRLPTELHHHHRGTSHHTFAGASSCNQRPSQRTQRVRQRKDGAGHDKHEHALFIGRHRAQENRYISHLFSFSLTPRYKRYWPIKTALSRYRRHSDGMRQSCHIACPLHPITVVFLEPFFRKIK